MKKILFMIVAILSVGTIASAEFNFNGEVMYRVMQAESDKPENNFFLNSFDNEHKFKFEVVNNMENANVRLLLESDGDWVRTAKITLWKKFNDMVEAQVRTELTTFPGNEGLRLIEPEDGETFIKLHPFEPLFVYLKPYDTNTDVGDLVQSIGGMNGVGGITGEVKFTPQFKMFYTLNSRNYESISNYQDADGWKNSWGTEHGTPANSYVDFDRKYIKQKDNINAFGIKTKAVFNPTADLEFTGEFGMNTQKDDNTLLYKLSWDPTNAKAINGERVLSIVDSGLAQTKMAFSAGTKLSMGDITLRGECLYVTPNERVAQTNKAGTAIAATAEYKNVPFVPVANKAWVEYRNYSKDGSQLFDLYNDDTKRDALTESLTRINAVGEVYWNNLTFAQEFEMKNQKDGFKDLNGNTSNIWTRITSIVKVYF